MIWRPYRRQLDLLCVIGVHSSVRYAGARPFRQRWTVTAVLIFIIILFLQPSQNWTIWAFPALRGPKTLHAWLYGPPVSGEQSSEVLERPLHSSYRRQQPTSTISQPASADCTALSADYIQPLGFLCGRPDGLELTTDWVSGSVSKFW